MGRNTVQLIILLYLIPALSDAQNVFPSYSDSGSWNVVQLILFPYGNLSTQVCKYEKDTSFCGNIYSKMNFYGNSCGYYRADSVKTYARNTTNCSDKEYLVYDYSLAVGDTAYVGNSLLFQTGTDSAPYVVNAIDTVNYFGINRKRMKMLYDPCSNFNLTESMYWISGIGSTTHPFYSFNCLCSGCEVAYTLLCYREDTLLLYKDPGFNTCDTTYTGMDEISCNQVKIKISPNPFNTSANIVVLSSDSNEAENSSFVLYNILGKEVKRISSIGQQTELNRDDLSNGIYLYKILSNDKIIDTGKIIIQ